MTQNLNLSKNIMPAVVQIIVEGYIGEEVGSILNPRIGELKDWTGSGFFIDSEFGEDIIITNAHVARNARTIEIMSMLTSEETFEAEVVGLIKNMEPDIAVLKLKSGELERFKKIANQKITYLKLCCENNIPRGTEIKAIGYPMGMSEPNITGGEITNYTAGDRYISEKLVTDAAINPGNSGGPAINTKGEVIGVNTSVIENADNIGFITPSIFIDIILKNLFLHNNLNFSDLGASFQKNCETIATELKMEECSGIIVTQIEENGFLEDAKVNVGDVILKINEHYIDRHGISNQEVQLHRKNIYDIIKLIPLGAEIKLEILRDGKILKINSKAKAFQKLKLTTKPIINDRTFIDAWGMTIQVLTYEIIEAFNMLDNYTFYEIIKRFNPKKERLIVTHIEKGSIADEQEWQIGEILYSINDVEISDNEHFLKLIRQHKKSILKTEKGTIGIFNNKDLESNLIKFPSEYLK